MNELYTTKYAIINHILQKQSQTTSRPYSKKCTQYL